MVSLQHPAPVLISSVVHTPIKNSTCCEKYTRHTQVVDARSSGRFEGSAPEPRPSIPSGHMIGAFNIPFYRMLNPESKIFKCKDELREGTIVL